VDEAFKGEYLSCIEVSTDHGKSVGPTHPVEAENWRTFVPVFRPQVFALRDAASFSAPA